MTRIRSFLSIAGICALAVGLLSCTGPTKRKSKPRIYTMGPTSGPQAGGTAVTIHTKGFKDDFTVDLPRVMFGGTRAVPVIATDKDTVEATTPAGPAGGGVVDVVVLAWSGQEARLANAFVYAP